MNNTSGVSGVSYRKGNQKWQVRIADDQHVGYFQTFNEAVAARKAAEKLHGYHPNHGR